MNEDIVRQAKDVLYQAINDTGIVNKNMDTDLDGSHYIAIFGDGFSYNIFIEIDERPYVKSYRPAVLWPVDDASPAESEIGGKFAFHIYKIECWPESGHDFDLTQYMNPEEIKSVEEMLRFDEDEFIEDDDLYESKKIQITEQDILYMVKRAINEVASKRTAMNRIYKLTHDITSHLYHDENWHGVTLVVDAIESLGYDCEVSVKDGGYRENDGAKWKEYLLLIRTPDGFEIHGTLNCHAAGTVEDPFDRYDMSLVMW